MKKVIIATTLVAAVVFTSLTVSSKSSMTKQAELPKIEKSDFASKGFAAQRNDLSSAD
ncbi:hypothetical protein [Mucilaginibacter agri]|uniref:Uncharacterized protein n=1 Tax=Mucilaginibacter agri TaxID=2695265 RepID=A0A965ZHM8_9SPHI|nr:hypothetical protein [Mucilaginibacter agri]NCD69886.1 hypothetical protein [Mucilaginibacter agri]